MGVFGAVDAGRHQGVVFGADQTPRLRTIIANHLSAGGPVLGATRFYPHASEQETVDPPATHGVNRHVATVRVGGAHSAAVGMPCRHRGLRLTQ